MHLIVLRLVDHISLPETSVMDVVILILILTLLFLGFYFATKFQYKHLKGKKTPTRSVKRRAYVRVPVQMNVVIVNQENQKEANVNLLDISAGGILLEGEESQLNSIKEFKIISDISPWKDVDPIVFRVVRAKKNNENQNLVLSCKLVKSSKTQKKTINAFVINKIKENLS